MVLVRNCGDASLGSTRKPTNQSPNSPSKNHNVTHNFRFLLPSATTHRATAKVSISEEQKIVWCSYVAAGADPESEAAHGGDALRRLEGTIARVEDSSSTLSLSLIHI